MNSTKNITYYRHRARLAFHQPSNWQTVLYLLWSLITNRQVNIDIEILSNKPGMIVDAHLVYGANDEWVERPASEATA
jgi:hypothetical protein